MDTVPNTKPGPMRAWLRVGNQRLLSNSCVHKVPTLQGACCVVAAVVCAAAACQGRLTGNGTAVLLCAKGVRECTARGERRPMGNCIQSSTLPEILCMQGLKKGSVW